MYKQKAIHTHVYVPSELPVIWHLYAKHMLQTHTYKCVCVCIYIYLYTYWFFKGILITHFIQNLTQKRIHNGKYWKSTHKNEKL